MASRVAEVIYRLKDLFTGPVKKVEAGYTRLRQGARTTADSVERQNARMSKSFGVLSGRMKGFFAGIAGGLAANASVRGLSSLADELDRLGKTADRLDIDPNTLSALEFAAERSGVAVERMTASIETLQKRTGEAVQGLGQARAAFERLGISVEDFIRLDAEQQLIVLADRISGVADEEERAALAAQLFSKQNARLLQVIGQGSGAFKELIARGKEYRTVTREQTEAAAAYNDALSNMSRQLDGIKFDAFTPILAEVSEFLDNIGQGDKLTGLTTELVLLEKQLGKTFVFDRRGVERRVQQIRDQLTVIRREREKNNAAAEAERAQVAKNEVANARYAASLEGLTDAYQDQAATRKKLLAEETAELAAARRAQASIESEFAGLVDSVTAPAPGDVFLLDVFEAIRKSKFALDTGELDQAIALARTGGDLLGQLKDKGTETQGTLQYLAQQLQTVATEAAQERTAAELVDVEQAQAAFDEIKAQAEILKTTAPAAGTDYARAFVAAMQAEFAATTLTPPAVAPPVVERTLVREGDSFSYRAEVDKRGAK